MLNSKARQGKAPGGWSGFTAGGRQGSWSLPFSPQSPSLSAACVDFRPSPPIPALVPAFATAACPFRVSTHKALGQAAWAPICFLPPSSPVVLASECPIAGEEVSHILSSPERTGPRVAISRALGWGGPPGVLSDGQVSRNLWG